MASPPPTGSVTFLFADEGASPKRQFDLIEFGYTSDNETDISNYASYNIPSPYNNYSGYNHPGVTNARYDDLTRMVSLGLRTKKEHSYWPSSSKS